MAPVLLPALRHAQDDRSNVATGTCSWAANLVWLSLVLARIARVGPALGLDAADIAAIREDMRTDPFLKNIVPRWPGSSTRLHGYRTGLDSAERYV